MPVSTERYRSTDISGDYAAMARAFGGYGERVTEPAEIVPAIRRGIAATERRQARAARVHHQQGGRRLQVQVSREPAQDRGRGSKAEISTSVSTTCFAWPMRSAFELARIRGSHHILVHSELPLMLNLQPAGGRAKRYQVRQLETAVREHGLKLRR